MLNLSDFQPTADLAQASTMPSRWYTEPQFLELEKEKIFWKTWQLVGHVSMVQRPGDFYTYDLFGEPLVITRTKEGDLRAFFNVCLHRAGPVASGRGNRKSLQCRYHGWTYDLNGRLLNAPEFEGVQNWRKEDFCLTAVRVTAWGPFIFVNLDANAPDLSEVLGNIPQNIDSAGFQINDMQPIERRDYIVESNWKVYIDNYLEGYHIPIAHPGLFREIDYDQYRVDTYRYYSFQYAPIRPEQPTTSQHRDRRYLRTEEEQNALYYWVFPNLMLNFYPDNMQINIIVPLDHERTLTIFEWYFRQPGTGAGWESMQQSIAFSDEVQLEDMEICQTVQKGLKSRAYDRGRFSVKRENGVHHFQSLVHEFLTR
ncbi:MAG: Rieske 2Fe-2S domain-containing protein [Anaerolineales bacterium]|nr:Rieske 2Fe-2S domain-containing protein [Anaerolineales bacterium]